jgi:hypothetical protein
MIGMSLSYHSVGLEMSLLFVRSETNHLSGQFFSRPGICKPFNGKLLEERDRDKFRLLSRETEGAFRQTAPARNQKELLRLKKRITHLKSQLTISPRRFGMCRTRALETEANPVDIDSVPEFLRQICQNTVLTGDQKKHRGWSASAMSLSFVLTRHRQRLTDFSSQASPFPQSRSFPSGLSRSFILASTIC